MRQRISWLFVALCLPLLGLWQFYRVSGWAGAAAPYEVIINEWSQGNGGGREWVELLVITGPVDLRGWDLGDESAGDLAFTSHPLWSSVSPGSLIVVYNGDDPDSILPPDDSDLGDCVAVLAHNSAFFQGGWPSFTDINANDNPHLREAAGETVHNFSVAPGPGGHPSAYHHIDYTGDTAAGVANLVNWNNDWAWLATPAAGNGGANTTWINNLCDQGPGPVPDLVLHKDGPTTAVAGSHIAYTLSLANLGNLTATGVLLTDTLPAGLGYIGDDSGFPVSQPTPGTLVWQISPLLAGGSTSFNLTATIASNVSGPVTNQAVASTSLTETNTANNSAQVTTVVAGSGAPAVLIEAVVYDGYQLNEPDEAVRLANVGDGAADLSGWQLNDGSTTAVFPAGVTLSPGQAIWLTKQATDFAAQFGFPPDFEVSESDPSIPNLSGSWPGYSNTGDEVILANATGAGVDVLVYESGNTSQSGWSGPAVQPYLVSGVFGAEGQILYRMRSQPTGRPVPDTNTASDWAQSPADVINGRKVLYPGWNLDDFFFTGQTTETASLTVAIAPDNAYEAIVAEIDAAQNSLRLASLTFENVAIATALEDALGRGVAVTVLLEGGPAGGITDQERYVCQQLEAASGQCWFMISNSTQQIYDRYRFLHAKYILIDGQRVIVSSENVSPDSLPDDDKSDGTWGRRGVALITDAPGVVARVQAIWDADFDPAAHADLFRWTAGHSTYGNPPPGYEPITVTGGTTYTVRYPAASTFQGTFTFEVVQSPENSLRDQDGFLGLLSQAGPGDTILIQQLNERPYWGESSSNPAADPNPRLEAYLAAARRGAIVRLLLDEFFDDSSDPLSNFATCTTLNDVARAEGLDLRCALGNPTGLGIHNKMVLALIGGQGTVHAGSINGTEQSHKGNREVALQIRSTAAYALLADMFYRDWPHRAYLPVTFHSYLGPVNYVLISEVLYDPPGPDDAEFIELANPTGLPVDLSNYSLGDAVHPTDFEDVRRFPAGTLILPQDTLVIATTATAFYAEYGFNPDFEVVNTDPAVPDLVDDPAWGDPAAILQLGNSGDEVILRDPLNQIVDAIAYGTGSLPGVVACPLTSTPNYSLERFPYWRDSNNCTADFREWPFPNPGDLP
ncbi:MAG: lamin tail domain-containing protein [Chloroflexi bacterium]|nr:lamin tail domain-containing protein [Chloroflexota bacterium]MCI0575408.1 lamin tail domain-containing protein [Chloroflexota bacterium]MCI0726731.1 lamin tail domain-containing protein [Chloroflexota bacterium]